MCNMQCLKQSTHKMLLYRQGSYIKTHPNAASDAALIDASNVLTFVSKCSRPRNATPIDAKPKQITATYITISRTVQTHAPVLHARTARNG